ncbi:gelsolin, cytoplasmic-like [Sycon ciliatum]|uniref:gelsolin, cytoplasmic-like n=1 Tax=Sycon ciliatum TaxID=27933 RepID=UPI0031F60A49
MAETAFSGAGQKDGLEIWRIEKMQVVAVPKDQYGKFHKGDSYIVLHTKRGSTGWEWHIHFWLGEETSKDEAGVAAYKSVELDDGLGGSPVQHREVQNHESQQFMSYFKGGVQYKEGGVASGFRKVDKTHKVRLLHIKGKRQVRVVPVDVKVSSLNRGDVFVLDNGQQIYVWNGDKSRRNEKMKGMEVARQLRDEERGGKAHIVVLEEKEDDEAFWKALGSAGRPKVIRTEDSDAADEQFERKNLANIRLYRVSDATGSLEVREISGTPLRHSQLDTNDCFIVDGGLQGIYSWVGKGCTKQRRRRGFLDERGLPRWVSVTQVIEGGETPLFKQMFASWPERDAKIGFGLQVTKTSTGGTTKVQFDPTSMHARAEAEIEKMPDQGSGRVEVFRVENMELTRVEGTMYGQFFGGDSYVLSYTYTDQRGREGYIVYFWLGNKSTNDEQGSAALWAIKKDEEVGGAAVQVRVVQGHEPEHFLRIFEGKLVIHEGGKASGFRNLKDTDSYDTDGTRLFHVRGTAPYNVKAVQVTEKASSLNSNDVFVLETPKATYVWNGKGASSEEKSFGSSIVDVIAPGSNVESVEEGSEPQGFWYGLGGKGSYADSPRLADVVPEQPPRLFHCSNASGRFLAEEILDFTQEDLNEDDVMIMDTYDAVYVWVGRNANAIEKKESLRTVKEYVETDPTNRSVEDTHMLQVKQGFEPPGFTSSFHGWDPEKWSGGKSYEELKAEMNDENAGITLVDAELEKYSKKYSYNDLCARHPPEGVDVLFKEKYLNDDEFQTVFGMSAADFEKLPKWKKDNLKKSKKLF